MIVMWLGSFSRFWGFCVCLLITCVVRNANADMNLVIEGSNPLEKFTEDSFSITCKAEGINIDSSYRPKLEWWNPSNTQNRPLTDADISRYNGRLEVLEKGRILKLTFIQIQGDAGGTYECRGTAQDGSVQSHKVQLILREKITFKDTPLEQYPIDGTVDAVIRCTVFGSPPPEVYWLVNKTKIDFAAPNSRYYAYTDGLHITNINSKDNANYTCRASVRLSTGEKLFEAEIRVVVAVKPVFAPGYEVQVVDMPIVKRMTRIRCHAEIGKPIPEYFFYKKNRPNDEINGGRFKVSQNAGPNQNLGELEIRDIQTEDGGLYTCRAVNKAGSTDITFNLKVVEPPELYRMDNQTYPLVTGKEKIKGSLTCMIRADPTPGLQFHKVGEQQPYVTGVQPNDPRINVRLFQPQGLDYRYAGITLEINNLTPEDSHNYTCVATNPAETRRWNGTITVQYRPNLSKTENYTYSWIGNIKNLTCIAMGEPIPIFQWWHRGEMIITGRNSTFKVYNETTVSKLQIDIPKEVSPSKWYWVFGVYSCNASNIIGVDSHLIELRKAIEPERPDSVNVIADTPRTVTFKAVGPNRPNQIAILGYIIEYKEVDDRAGAYKGRMAFAWNETLKMYDLLPTNVYIFRTTAYNPVGNSQQAIEIRHTMADIRKPYPIILTSKNVSTYPYFYEMQWDEPDNGGRGITKFFIGYRMVEVDPANETMVISDGDWTKLEAKLNPKLHRYRLKNLKANRYYEVDIQAENVLGKSEITGASQMVFRTLQATDGETGPIIAASSKVHLYAQALVLTIVMTFLLS
ncbi:fasciclin-2-like [Lineus longissimus]|uniref:fasciclin-2-like n=1 Tax=Lineus longissimus TaxID=88925 RepID=UPI002B4D3537